MSALVRNSVLGMMAFESIRGPEGQIVDFRWLYVNPEAERIVGMTATQLVGHRLLDILPGNREDGLFARYAQTVESRQGERFQHFYMHEGIRHYFDIQTQPFRDGFVVSFHDMTPTKSSEMRARAERSRMMRLADTLPITLGFVRKDLTYAYGNMGYQRWFGADVGLLNGRRVRDVLGEPVFDSLAWDMKRALQGETLRFEAMLPVRGGQTLHAELTYLPDRGESGEIHGFTEMMIDISAIKLRQTTAEEEAREFDTILENLPVGAIHVTPQRFYINRKVQELTGYRQDDLTHLDDWFERAQPDGKPHYESARQQGFPKGCLGSVTRIDGSTFQAQFLANRYPGGEVWIMVPLDFPDAAAGI